MHIAVLFGGDSSERDVSITSGAQVIEALRTRGHQVMAIDTAQGVLTKTEEKRLFTSRISTTPNERQNAGSSLDAVVQLPELKSVDLVFLALHGGAGEDGTLQTALDYAHIVYTGSGPTGSANAMDKQRAKKLFHAAGVPAPDGCMAPIRPDEITRRFDFPLVVKPNKQGSTVGLTIVHYPEDIEQAISAAYQYDDEVMIEQFIPGRELTVGILDHQALGVGEIIPQCSTIFDYESKYQAGGAKEIFTAELSEAESGRIQALALKAHHALQLNGYSRIDFRMDATGTCWCLEANSLPGMTPSSLLPQSARAVGISFEELCERICRLAVENKEHRSLL